MRASTISKSLSVYLDFLRAGAALLVVFGHLTQKYFSVGWPDCTSIAVAAVAIFFVMSGYVIEYTTPRHETLRSYLVARLARIYSVAVPAVILTLFCLLVGRAINPAFYDYWQAEYSFFWIRPFTSLTFTNAEWGRDLSVSTNSPFWSLGYEVPFYLIFGVATYLKGAWRSLLLLLLGGIVGPVVLVLLPVWWLGVWLCRFLRSRAPSERLVPAYLVAILAALASGLLLHKYVDPICDRNDLLRYLFMGRSRVAIFLPVGLAACFSIAVVKACEERLLNLATKVEGVIKAFAQFTFSMYLYHFPLLVFFAAITRYDKASPVAKLTCAAAVITSCWLLSLITEKKKSFWVGLIGRILPKSAASSPT